MTREELLVKRTALKDPRPDWESFKRIVGMMQGDIDKALKVWRRTKNR